MPSRHPGSIHGFTHGSIGGNLMQLCSGILLLLLCLIFFLPLGCGVGATGAAESGTNLAGASAIPPVFFGMAMLDPEHSAAVPSATERLAGGQVDWAAIEPQRGVFAWSTLDAAVAQASATGTGLLLVLGQAPAWAAVATTLPPAQQADWDSYIQAVASRYQGKISAYQIWSDPAQAANWTGNVSQMVALEEDAYGIIKRIDPAATVVSPGGPVSWVSQFLTAGGGSYADAIGAALSAGSVQPEQDAAAAITLASVLTQNGVPGKPVWNTSEQPALAPPAPQDAASWVARALVIDSSFGIGRLYWYAWDGGPSPLEAEAGTANPAAAAYQQVEGWLIGATANGCAEDASGTWRCQFSQRGATEWVVWNSGGTASVSSMGATTATAIDGSIQDIAAGSGVIVSPSPLLLR